MWINPHNNHMRQILLFFHFAGEETGLERSHSYEIVHQNSNTMDLNPRARFLTIKLSIIFSHGACILEINLFTNIY